MIPASHPYEAHFKRKRADGSTYRTSEPVIAWNDDGDALVADERTGCLKRANASHDFDGVEQRAVPVATLPGGGWAVAWKQDDGTEQTYPVLGWTVDSLGWATPLDVDPDGSFAEPLRSASAGHYRLIPPGQDPQSLA